MFTRRGYSGKTGEGYIRAINVLFSHLKSQQSSGLQNHKLVSEMVTKSRKYKISENFDLKFGEKRPKFRKNLSQRVPKCEKIFLSKG